MCKTGVSSIGCCQHLHHPQDGRETDRLSWRYYHLRQTGGEGKGAFAVKSYRDALIDAILEHDPAARSRLEVRLLYPGYKAVMSHCRAAWFHRHGFKLTARWISQSAARRTGIEIHPGAKIGRGVMIDHGHGVVIGETAEVGDGCMIYQGVTLGGTGKQKGKRHPTLGRNVLVGAGAKVLGPFSVGDNARIAAGAVVLSEVPPDATAVGVPAKVVRVAGQRPPELDQIHFDDPVWQELLKLRREVGELREALDIRKQSDENK